MYNLLMFIMLVVIYNLNLFTVHVSTFLLFKSYKSQL
jgi:hypothetical protein